MDYVKKISSLEEKASAQVAINLCQGNGFKEVVLCLEKPTYGAFIPYKNSPFVSDPEKLSVWAKMKKHARSLSVFKEYSLRHDTDVIKQWDVSINEQCQRLTEGIPHFLRQGIYAWINRIALEYLNYCRRQEALFGISCYFLMNIFTRDDWKEAGHLDEMKLAQRLLNDERLTVLQRYRIACLYCLYAHIPQLWNKLSPEQKQLISGSDTPYLSMEKNHLVLLWSYHLNGQREEKVTGQKDHLWKYAAQKATFYGNYVALILCWKELKVDMQQQIVIDLALESVEQWCIIKEMYLTGSFKGKLISNQGPLDVIKNFNLPSYYSKLLCFFLSQMNEEQQLTFFKKAFQRRYCDSVLQCFLEWPHQDYFLPTINRLWGIIPKQKYGECLLTLASKWSDENEKENCYYDYRSLLRELWEGTPEEYKVCVFHDKKRNEGKVLLARLLERSPFQEDDETVFKLIFCDQPEEERRAMMQSKLGENICSLLTEKEKWPFINWLLEECLSKEEIPSFKKQFIQSHNGVKLCLDKVKENRERLVEDLIDWSLELDTEKSQYKYELVSANGCLEVCESLLRTGEFTKVEHMINFCLSSDEMKEQFKVHFASHSCSALLEDWANGALLEDCVWKQMDTILAWGVETEEKIKDIKKDLFSRKGITIYTKIIFLVRRWEEVEPFCKWFDLSPEEIKILEELEIEFKKELEERFEQSLDERREGLGIDVTHEEEKRKKAQERFNYLMSELNCFRKNVHGETSREGISVVDKGEKRSSVMIKDESSSPRKRCKSVESKINDMLSMLWRVYP